MMTNKNYQKLTWFILAATAVVFFFNAYNFVAFPKSYRLPLLIGLAILLFLTWLWSFKSTKAKQLSTIVNTVLSIILLFTSIYIPVLEKKMTNVFVDTDTQETVEEEVKQTINVYAFSTEYKKKHPDIMDKSNIKNTVEGIENYIGCGFITQKESDLEEQDYALAQIKKSYIIDEVWIISTNNLHEQLSSFYGGEGELVIVSSERLDEIKKDYKDFEKDTVLVQSYQKEDMANNRAKGDDKNIIDEPFTVLITGNDTWSSKVSQYGRTDVNILLAINPKTYDILIFSLPRDAFIKNPDRNYSYDKLTHLGNSGIRNTMKGISGFFDIPIDHYLSVNFSTFQTIVDAIGGIDIDNPYSFSASADAGGGFFPTGELHLNGEDALIYVRERQNLINGDFGRIEHQTIALKALLNKLTSPSMIMNFNSLLTALNGQFLTSLNPDHIYKIAASTLDHHDGWNIMMYHLEGVDGVENTASVRGEYLYVAKLIIPQVEFMVNEIKDLLESKDIEQKEMPPYEQIIYQPE